MGDGDTVYQLRAHEVALLRAGARAAVTVAVVDLHLRGVVEAGRPGTLRTSETSTEGAGQDLPLLAEAVHGALLEPAGPRDLLRAADVRRGLGRVRAGLKAAGFLRTLPPRRTRAARRALDDLLAAHPLPTSRQGLSDADALLAVALHGEPALKVVAARFALRTGLTARVEVKDRDRPRGTSRGGGTGGTEHFGGGGYSCGAG
ncbi:TIGR04222 domain-containing membrane protein [Streptomyces sp. YKOK-I1]